MLRMLTAGLEGAMTLLTPADVALQLKVPRSWVYRAVRNDSLPCVRCGRYVRFLQADVDAWVSARRSTR